MKHLTLAACLLALTTTARANPPGQLHYQGMLRDADGLPLRCPTPGLDCPSGPIDLTFRLYRGESDGPALWTETHQGVVVRDGYFHVILGQSAAIDATHLEPGEAWLGVEVGADGEMIPRQRIVSSAYAIVCERAGTATNALHLGGRAANLYALSADVTNAGYLTVEELELYISEQTVVTVGPGHSCVPGDLVVADGAGGWTCASQTPAADTLGALSCDAGAIAKWDGESWRCARDALAEPVDCGDASFVRAVDADGVASCQPVLPTGAIMFFDGPCPAGWAAWLPGVGRVVLGVDADGTPGATTGAALAPGDTPTHSHATAPASLEASAAGAHTHVVDPPSVNSAGGGVDHTHHVPAQNRTTSSDAHAHRWAFFNEGEAWHTYTNEGNSSVTLVDWGVNQALGTSPGSGNRYPLAKPGSVVGNVFYWTTRDAHSHTYTAGNITSQGASAYVHTHAIDVPATTSASAGQHTHTVTVPAGETVAAAHGMPYVQLTVCRKE